MGESSPANLKNENGEPKSPHFGKGRDTVGSLVWDPVWADGEKSESLIKIQSLEPDPKKIPEVKPPGDDPKADPKKTKDPKEKSDWVWDCDGPYFLEFWEQEMPKKLYPNTKQLPNDPTLDPKPQIDPKNPKYNPTETDNGPIDSKNDTGPTTPPTKLGRPKFTPKKEWENLSRALGFLATANPSHLAQKSDEPTPGQQNLVNHPNPSIPNPKNPKNDPKGKFPNYTIDGSFKIDGNEVPLQIENLKIDQNGQVLPLRGKTDQLGPYTTHGNMDFDQDQLFIERKFDNGVLFSGTGIVDPKKNMTQGNWKMNFGDSQVKNDLEGFIGTKFPDKPKLIGGWKACSNNGEIYDWNTENGEDPENLGGGSNDPKKQGFDPKKPGSDPKKPNGDPRF
jgi:hypothetical protein